MLRKPLVSVLILTFNRADLLKNCLDSVLKSDYPNLEFVVSDNGSKEDIADFVKKKFSRKKIQVVRLNKNKGLTGGFNFGFTFCKGKYVMLLSNDTKIAKDAISNMVEMAEKDSSIGIVSPQIIQMRNPRFLHNVGSFITKSGLLYHYGILQNQNRKLYKKSYYIFSCNGAGFLIRKETAECSGLFEESFFYFYDDSDLSHRVWLSGYSVVYCPRAYLWHVWSATMQGVTPQIWYHNHRNHISSFMRNLSLPNLILFLLNFNLTLMFWFIINLFKLRFDICITLPKTYLWQLMHIKETWRARNHIQNEIRKVSDSEIFRKCLVSPGWRYYFFYLGLSFKDQELPKRVLYK